MVAMPERMASLAEERRSLSRADSRSDKRVSSSVMDITAARSCRNSSSAGSDDCGAGTPVSPAEDETYVSSERGAGVPHQGQKRSLAAAARPQLRQFKRGIHPCHTIAHHTAPISGMSVFQESLAFSLETYLLP